MTDIALSPDQAVVDETVFPAPAVTIAHPDQLKSALICASPHSGTNYTPRFLAQSRLDPRTLRRSEDAFIDDLFAAAPAQGAPLLKALFPRAFCDPNREAWELDPTMFVGTLPSWVNRASQKVAVGLGTIARVVASGAEIYRHRLDFAEAEARVAQCWRPYHQAQFGLIEAAQSAFGVAVLLDCHSMPSVGGPADRDPGQRRPDIVLGDRFGKSCAPAIIDRAEALLKDSGLGVARNDPYAGGYSTEHYGRPGQGVHTLQIEINRALYMDETAITRHDGFDALQKAMTRLIAGLVEFLPPNGTL